MLILYGATGAGSVAPQALLTHLQVPFELRLIDFDANEDQSAAFLAINPRGQIPVLVMEDGSVLTESLAIMLHVADCHPSSGLSPALGSAERAQLYRWMSFLSTNVYEGLLRLLYPDMYTTSSDLASVVDSADQYLLSAFGLINQHLGQTPWLVGERSGIADIYLAMLLTWYLDQPKLYAAHPNLQRALEHTLAIEGVSKVFVENELV
jgi:glutathione S-transferase